MLGFPSHGEKNARLRAERTPQSQGFRPRPPAPAHWGARAASWRSVPSAGRGGRASLPEVAPARPGSRAPYPGSFGPLGLWAFGVFRGLPLWLGVRRGGRWGGGLVAADCCGAVGCGGSGARLRSFAGLVSAGGQAPPGPQALGKPGRGRCGPASPTRTPGLEGGAPCPAPPGASEGPGVSLPG